MYQIKALLLYLMAFKKIKKFQKNSGQVNRYMLLY